MGKNKLIKWIIPLSLGALLLGTGHTKVESFVHASTPTTITQAQVSSTTGEKVTINNPQIRDYLIKALNKNANSTFYSKDFLNSPLFAPTTTEDQSGTPVTTIPTYCLDLTGTGITNLTEFMQFEFPENIQSINMDGNNITNDDLSNITTILSKKVGDKHQFGDREIDVRTNFSTQIKVINLNNNKIDLPNTSSTYLQETRLFFGIQNLDINNTGLIRKGEINPSFYVRSNENGAYLTCSFYNDLSTSSTDEETKSNILKYDQVVTLNDIGLTDRYDFRVYAVPSITVDLFTGYDFHREFILFDIYLKEDFTVQRKHILDLKINDNHKRAEGSPLIIEGFGNGDSLNIYDLPVSTSRLTTDNYKNEVNIIIEKEMFGSIQRRTIPVEFVVVDTIAPVIKLIGTSYAYSSKNKDYYDPGVTAYDPSYIGDDTGDDLTQMVYRDTSDLDITSLGVYKIKYTVSDLAGNITTIERTVEIQERVLDSISVRCNADKITDGDDIVLVVQPDYGVPISNYKNIKYEWYLNDTLIQTTVADSTGKSTITIVADSTTSQTIRVKVTANQVSNNAPIEIYSNTLDLKVNHSLRNDNTIIVAVAIVLLLIILIITIATIIKYRKAHKTHSKRKLKKAPKSDKKDSKKSKNKKSDKNPKNDSNTIEIQVIKDFTGDPNSSKLFTGSDKPDDDGADNPTM